LILDLDVGNPKSSKGRRSLITWENWTVGSGGVLNYSQNGLTAENQRTLEVNPWGAIDVVWGSYPSGDGNSDGGWDGASFSIDNTKLYRFSTWIRRTSDTTGGTFYLGTNANGDGVRRTDNGAVQGNPYWDCRNIGWMTKNEWYLVTGHIYPYTTSYTGRHPESGVYTISGRFGDIGGCNIGQDLKWSQNTTSAMHRSYHYYCGDNTSRLQWYQPRVDLCDGTEPSIAELLSNAGNKLYDMSAQKNDHFIVGQPLLTADKKAFDITESHSFNKPTSLSGATNACTVVLWYKTTDTQELWVRGNNSGSHYLSASYGNDYYHSNIGTPTNYVDLATVTNPATPTNYRNGAYHMWEAKNVDFSTWTVYDWFGYGSSWNMSGTLSKILVYNRTLTANESKQNFVALRGRYGL
jgi:hypothetical protein